VSSPSAKPERPYTVLKHQDFRLLWGSQLVSLTGTQMQVVALNWHVYLLTHSPLALGMVGLSRVLPIILFSLWGGIVADRFDRRRVMFAAQSCMAAFSVALAVLTVQGRTSLAVLYGLNAAGAAASAFDNPARQALVPRLVPPAALSSALSLNLGMFHMAMIGGPGVAGLVLAAGSRGLGSVAAIYAFNAFSFVVVLVALALMKTSGRPAATDAPLERPWAARKGRPKLVLNTPPMVW
jgi:MFS family permease